MGDGLARFCVVYIQWTYLYRLLNDTWNYSGALSWSSASTLYSLLGSDTMATFLLQFAASAVAPKQWYIFFVVIYGVQRAVEFGYHGWRSYDDNNYRWFYYDHNSANASFYEAQGWYLIVGPFVAAVVGTTIEILMWVLGTDDFLELADYED